MRQQSTGFCSCPLMSLACPDGCASQPAPNLMHGYEVLQRAQQGRTLVLGSTALLAACAGAHLSRRPTASDEAPGAASPAPHIPWAWLLGVCDMACTLTHVGWPGTAPRVFSLHAALCCAIWPVFAKRHALHSRVLPARTWGRPRDEPSGTEVHLEISVISLPCLRPRPNSLWGAGRRLRHTSLANNTPALPTRTHTEPRIPLQPTPSDSAPRVHFAAHLEHHPEQRAPTEQPRAPASRQPRWRGLDGGGGARGTAAGCPQLRSSRHRCAAPHRCPQLRMPQALGGQLR